MPIRRHSHNSTMLLLTTETCTTDFAYSFVYVIFIYNNLFWVLKYLKIIDSYFNCYFCEVLGTLNDIVDIVCVLKVG